jgi:hypothetical protein
VCVTGRRLGELEKVSGDDWTNELMTRRSLRNATTIGEMAAGLVVYAEEDAPARLHRYDRR